MVQDGSRQEVGQQRKTRRKMWKSEEDFYQAVPLLKFLWTQLLKRERFLMSKLRRVGLFYIQEKARE